ncbi:uncharacterized protein ACHE_41179S [Aspergillus chevalieri]|uniref:Uncharacterized protein n=1 Tax=Aspergillus chevalieri TaxID=182096 RepID=A0A7R7VPW1_ASPCH|nr:uncharacterized protein ACHE_41179S [Aspergillus chevalieri]BCR88615.1 hypothetical protein ACHE_41179S [Aspergillus chevalieri]
MYIAAKTSEPYALPTAASTIYSSNIAECNPAFKNATRPFLAMQQRQGVLNAADLLDNLARTQTTDSNDDKIDSDFYYHPLFKKGYTPEAILEIQKAFLEPSKQTPSNSSFSSSIEAQRQTSSSRGGYVKSGDNKIFDLLLEMGAR